MKEPSRLLLVLPLGLLFEKILFKNIIKIKVGQVVLEFIDPNNILTVLIHNLTTIWPFKMMPFFLVPWTINYKMHYFSQKSVDNFEIEHKIC